MLHQGCSLTDAGLQVFILQSSGPDRSSATAACVRWIMEPQSLLAIPGQRNDAIDRRRPRVLRGLRWAAD
jgi:hypothetical protein